MDRVDVCDPHEFCVSMDNPGESLGKSGRLEIDYILAPGWYHLVLGQEKGVFLEVTGGNLTGE